MMAAVAEEKVFAPDFAAFEAEHPGGPGWLRELRGHASARFAQLGFPNTKVEAWRYTSVRPIVERSWTLATRAPHIVPPPPGQGVVVTSLHEAISRNPEKLVRFLGKVALSETSAFAALNTAFFEDGVFIEIARGAVVAEPIELNFEASGAEEGEAPEVSYPRVLVSAGEQSQATIVESWTGRGGRPYFCNAVTEIVAGDGAVLQHVKIQREDTAAFHVQAIAARVGRSARFTSHNIALGGAIARTDIDVLLAEEGAECELNGLFLGSGRQHIDNHTLIDHAKPHGSSRELYKGIMDGQSRGIFHGLVIVRHGAQKTDAIQTNKNLLLSREALVNSTPALQILADDVKCKHGSTTGQIDEAALFYLRSRGIGEAEARALMTWAFASDVVLRIPVPSVRAAVEAVLGARLPSPPESR
jgi:Fe-S cluster assembly protein SufD